MTDKEEKNELVKILKPDFIFGDNRGRLTQLVHEGFKQVNVITSIGGVKRGGHYHRINAEAFFVVSGEFDLVARHTGKKEKYHCKEGDMFLIPKMVSHDFFYTDKTVLVSLYDRGVELSETEKDIYKD